MGQMCCTSRPPEDLMSPTEAIRSDSMVKPMTSQNNKYRPRSFKKNKAMAKSFVNLTNQTTEVNISKILNQNTFDGEPSFLNQTVGAELTSVMKEQLYFEEQQRKDKERKELIHRCRSNTRTMKTLIRVQAIVRGIITRKKIYKQYKFRSFTAISAKQVAFFNPIVHDLKKTLPAFVYDETQLKDDIEREFKKIVKDDESMYDGQVNSSTGLRDGRGTQTWVDGSYYEGYWKNGKSHGRGRLIHSVGDVYEGLWVNDMANGKGKLVIYEGPVYVGDFLNDQQTGKGIETLPSGDYYEGSFVNGAKEGQGVFKWVDGSMYSGQFKQNMIHGYGKYTWADGRCYQGYWIKGKMHGKGVFTWLDGRKYEGEYYDDKKHGKGTFSWPDGKKYQGDWLYGQQHGFGFYWASRDSDKRKGEWINGKRVRWCEENY
ncbi:morn repeat protein [Stylonychia lemnae]|uniref:Morn repeat protein n=1 Tax=Stylonychia lemnae TaxID=5949 RepID=A0A078B290_STYLE|nr:morn repeat protein [Stylonychia lemnae]|eukprot:CDW87367.1 morn repeat protein [Stylonychia lemnae]